MNDARFRGKGNTGMVTVWGRQSSTNVVKVLWLCEVIGLPVDRRDVGGSFGGLDEPAFRALNPNGLIPTIEDDGHVAWESHAVLRYVAAKYGPDELYPADLTARSEVERWLDWHLGTLAPVLNPVFIALYRTPAAARKTPEEMERLVGALSGVMTRLDAHLQHRSFIAGDAFTIADAAFGNSIWRWFSFPFEKAALPALQAWQARVAEKPGWREHVAQPLA